MIREIKNLKKNDRIRGTHAILQVISNDDGDLYLYNETTGVFCENNLKRYKNNFVEICD